MMVMKAKIVISVLLIFVVSCSESKTNPATTDENNTVRTLHESSDVAGGAAAGAAAGAAGGAAAGAAGGAAAGAAGAAAGGAAGAAGAAAGGAAGAAGGAAGAAGGAAAGAAAGGAAAGAAAGAAGAGGVVLEETATAFNFIPTGKNRNNPVQESRGSEDERSTVSREEKLDAIKRRAGDRNRKNEISEENKKNTDETDGSGSKNDYVNLHTKGAMIKVLKVQVGTFEAELLNGIDVGVMPVNAHVLVDGMVYNARVNRKSYSKDRVSLYIDDLNGYAIDLDEMDGIQGRPSKTEFTFVLQQLMVTALAAVTIDGSDSGRQADAVKVSIAERLLEYARDKAKEAALLQSVILPSKRRFLIRTGGGGEGGNLEYQKLIKDLTFSTK